jgi:hypothetical protein
MFICLQLKAFAFSAPYLTIPVPFELSAVYPHRSDNECCMVRAFVCISKYVFTASECPSLTCASAFIYLYKRFPLNAALFRNGLLRKRKQKIRSRLDVWRSVSEGQGKRFTRRVFQFETFVQASLRQIACTAFLSADSQQHLETKLALRHSTAVRL